MCHKLCASGLAEESLNEKEYVMKYTLNLETLGLSKVVNKGRTVREDLLKEIEHARGRMTKVDWRQELETFRAQPLDTAQAYFNQLNDAIRAKIGAPEAAAGSAKAPNAVVETPPVKKPTAKKRAAKKPAQKRSSVKKAAVSRTTGKKATSETKGGKTQTSKTSARKASATKPSARRAKSTTGARQPKADKTRTPATRKKASTARTAKAQ